MNKGLRESMWENLKQDAFTPEPQMQSPALEARGVVKVFGGDVEALEVLRGIDFQVQPGEKVAIVGASGSGKSTLLHILGGLDDATAGSITLSGIEFTELDEAQQNYLRNKELGFIYQFHHLLPEFSALENVAMPLRIRGLSKSQAQSQAEAIFDSSWFRWSLQAYTRYALWWRATTRGSCSGISWATQLRPSR